MGIDGHLKHRIAEGIGLGSRSFLLDRAFLLDNRSFQPNSRGSLLLGWHRL
jgi:hypothetical protein